MKLRYTDRSKDDIELAFTWYERQRKGLGFEFLDCVEASLQNIITHVPDSKNKSQRCQTVGDINSVTTHTLNRLILGGQRNV